MKAERITILEASLIAGIALDGDGDAKAEWLIRGGREMEAHFECLWDLYRSIPSLEIENASVLDEFFWLNRDDPNYSLQRATVEQGKHAKAGLDFTLTANARKELLELLLVLPEQLDDKRINGFSAPSFSPQNSGSIGERCSHLRSGTLHSR